MASAASGGLLSGSTRRRNVPNSPEPSMRAASNNSSGKVRMNWRIRKIPKALMAPGTINARYEFSQ